MYNSIAGLMVTTACCGIASQFAAACRALLAVAPALTHQLPHSSSAESKVLRTNLPYVCMLVALDAYHDNSLSGIGLVAEQR